MKLLEGVRIIDLSELAPGPFCTLILSDLGADVVKVERPSGDPIRNILPGAYETLNRNKRSIALDLKDSSGREVFLNLVKRAEVVTESFRPGVAVRLGVGYEQVKEVNDRIIYCSISGYGQTGPYRDRPGHDVNYCAVAGISSISGEPEGPPAVGSGVPIADFTSSLYACISIISMLHAGQSGYLDVSMTDCALHFMLTRISEVVSQNKPAGEKHTGRGGYGIFETKDKKYIALAPVEEHFWQRFCRQIGLENLLTDPRFDTFFKRTKNGSVLNRITADALLLRTQKEWIDLLVEADVPCSPVNNIDEVLQDPHILQRGQLNTAGTDDRKTVDLSFPACFNGQRLFRPGDGPSFPGRDAEQILADSGYGRSEIKRLRETGVLGKKEA